MRCGVPLTLAARRRLKGSGEGRHFFRHADCRYFVCRPIVTKFAAPTLNTTPSYCVKFGADTTTGTHSPWRYSGADVDVCAGRIVFVCGSN